MRMRVTREVLEKELSELAVLLNTPFTLDNYKPGRTRLFSVWNGEGDEKLYGFGPAREIYDWIQGVKWLAYDRFATRTICSNSISMEVDNVN